MAKMKKTGSEQVVGKFKLVEYEAYDDTVVFVYLGKQRLGVYDSFGEAMQKKGEWLGTEED